MVSVSEKRMVIPTYPEQEAEKLPMFAENRVHQRSSGNPYPNAVVIKTHKKEKIDREYNVVILENEYLSLWVLPELGGRIFRAIDKTTGYDFFYRQHVIKPALIGALGSWISGGVEFNWPYHHRPSTFLPTDYEIEHEENGAVIVWMSEHDPINRMKGMVGIRLEPGKSIFETRVRLYNRTAMRQSFLWWENTAVPVNPEYRIFFPPDVDHVYFHYRRNSTTFPLANGWYNGYDLGKNADISLHGTSLFSTSYFSAASKFDFFGGYDEKKKCGVVHYSNHHTSTGKKMFTWAYNQLAESWERALTDEDGAYAELMAGSYSNNQPDFTWLMPYETKCFSQYWYPLAGLGVPNYANEHAAVRIDGEKLLIQPTEKLFGAAVSVYSDGNKIFDRTLDLTPGLATELSLDVNVENWTVKIVKDGRELLNYTLFRPKAEKTEPSVLGDIPLPGEAKSAYDAYKLGIHLMQYRDPKADCEKYFEKAIELDPAFAPAYTVYAENLLRRGAVESAEKLLKQALSLETLYNGNPEGGRTHYLLGLAQSRLGRNEDAYDSFYKAYWCEDSISASMTRIAMLDGINGDMPQMLDHSNQATEHNTRNLTALSLAALARLKSGKAEETLGLCDKILSLDPLFHLARYIKVLVGAMPESEFYAKLSSSPSQTCLDIYDDLAEAGFICEAKKLLNDLIKYSKPVSAMVYYMLGKAPAEKSVCRTFPFRDSEEKALRAAVKADPEDSYASYLLGCLLYSRKQYQSASELWKNTDDASTARCLAVYDWRMGDREAAIKLLKSAFTLDPQSEQLLYELFYTMNQNKSDIGEFEKYFKLSCQNIETVRDDIAVEFAKAYNRCGKFEQAAEILAAHSFTPCEGGEGAVTSQYMAAWFGLGKKEYDNGNLEKAIKLFRQAQVLPKNLGAGLWNQGPLVPSRYYEGLCLEKLGDRGGAVQCYNFIIGLLTDFFSDMHLPALDLWKAAAYRRLGEYEKADATESAVRKKWTDAKDYRDSGYFATTPFFISYMDDARTAREKYYDDLLSQKIE